MQYTHPYIGNTATVASLQKLLKSGKIPQSNLIVGPKHVGKTSLIHNMIFETVVSELQVEHDWSTGKLPRSQPYVHLLKRDTYPNVIEIRPEVGKTGIGITQIQVVLSSLRKTSFIDGLRHVIIEPAEAMSASAINACLKQVEEPNTQVVFWFISHQPSLIAATLQSRCAIWQLQPATAEEMASLPNVTKEELHWLSGLPGKHMALRKDYGKFMQLFNHWTAVLLLPNLAERTQYVESHGLIAKSATDLTRLVDALEMVLHINLAATTNSPVPNSITENPNFVQLVKRSTSAGIAKRLQLTQQAREWLQFNVQNQYILNSLLLHL